MRKLSLLLASVGLVACNGTDQLPSPQINFAPIITLSSSKFQFTENQPSSFTILGYDADGGNLTYSLSGLDQAAFNIDPVSGLVEFSALPDFELPADSNQDNIYDITASVSDGQASGNMDITVTITDDPTDNPDTFAQCEDYSDFRGPQANYFACEMLKEGPDLGRTFIIYVPPTYQTTAGSVPMLFSLHGYGSFAGLNLLYTGFKDIADIEGFPVIYPQGEVLEISGQTHWNVGGWTVGSSADDVGFINTISAYMSAVYDIDTSRVYSTGMSNGGFMSYVLACEMADKFAAIGSVTGSMTPETYADCNASRPVPVLQIHGRLDPTVPLNGSNVGLPLADVIDYWASANNCQSGPLVSVIPDGPDSDSLGGTFTRHESCDDDVAVEFYLLDAVEHQWPNRRRYDIHAADVVWEFVSQYNLNGEIE